MVPFFSILITLIATVICYIISRMIYQKIKLVIFLPIVLATTLIIILLTGLQMSYEAYMEGAKFIHALLGPAVVALAYPLYLQRKLLIKLAIPILIGSLIGAIIGVISVLIVAPFFQFEDELLYSVLPKSVTTPVAMDISHSLGGISSLAAVLVIIAGITGVVSSKMIFRLFNIRSKVGRGVAFGAASHAIGTTRALELGDLEGSISTIAMIVSAVYVSIITQPLVHLFL